MTDQIARALRSAILTSTFSLGQRLREAELATRFGVSHSVIREAMHILQGEGLMTTSPFRGRSVFQVSAQEANELWITRTMLESYAAMLAAEKVTSEQAAELAGLAEWMLTAPCQGYAEWVDREMRFHGAIWRAAGSAILTRQIHQCFVPTFTFGALRHFQPDEELEQRPRMIHIWETGDSPRGHQRITQAILARNGQSARDEMVRHILPDPSHAAIRQKHFGF